KYMGEALLQKTYTVDCLTKKRVINDGIVPQYYVKNSHDPIVSKEFFDRVQFEKKHRSDAPKIYNVENTKIKKGRYSQYALSRIVVCGECGRFYRRVTSASYKRYHSGESQVTWRCNNRMEYGKKFCLESPTIKEKYLREGVVNAINHLILNKRFIKKRIKKQTAHKHALNNQAFSLKDMMEFLEACIAEIAEFDDIIVRKLIDKITVISKSRLLVRFKDGTEIEQGISAGK
ncbi:zinc ribbon domain-containing protein, partial [Desulfosporosinus metallidurans]